MYYGFDIGGTKIALGVFDSGRQLQWEKRRRHRVTAMTHF